MAPVSIAAKGILNRLDLMLLQVIRALLTLATLLLPVVHAVQPVNVQGSEFINSVTGKRFQMIGVA
jgi:hypothetical protein